MAYKDGVSIIVTVFNKQDYIEKTLKSIFKQMNSLTQLIVVNDGSTDNSLNLIKKNLQNLKYENKLITQKNLGPSISINNALRFVKYSNIKLVDGDDIIAPDALSYMKKEMNGQNQPHYQERTGLTEMCHWGHRSTSCPGRCQKHAWAAG